MRNLNQQQTTANDNTPSFSELQKTAHDTSVRNGFWDYLYDDCHTVDDYLRAVATFLMLISDESHEALAEFRSGEFSRKPLMPPEAFVEQVPEAVGEELADVIIRTMDLAEGLDIDLYEHVVAKVEKNKGRTFRHGKNF